MQVPTFHPNSRITCYGYGVVKRQDTINDPKRLNAAYLMASLLHELHNSMVKITYMSTTGMAVADWGFQLPHWDRNKNGRYFRDYIFKWFFLDENVRILIKITVSPMSSIIFRCVWCLRYMPCVTPAPSYLRLEGNETFYLSFSWDVIYSTFGYIIVFFT